MFGSLLGIAAPLLGGLLGSDSGNESQTTQQKLDPRMDQYIYGADGKSGLLGSAFNLAQEQLKTGGLNDLQRQGLDMQRQYLMSPQYQQGFGNMGSLGQSLMGGGVAGNPFTGGSRAMAGAASPFEYSGLQGASLPDFKAALGMLQTNNPPPADPVAAKDPKNNPDVWGLDWGFGG